MKRNISESHKSVYKALVDAGLHPVVAESAVRNSALMRRPWFYLLGACVYLTVFAAMLAIVRLAVMLYDYNEKILIGVGFLVFCWMTFSMSEKVMLMIARCCAR